MSYMIELVGREPILLGEVPNGDVGSKIAVPLTDNGIRYNLLESWNNNETVIIKPKKNPNNWIILPPNKNLHPGTFDAAIFINGSPYDVGSSVAVFGNGTFGKNEHFSSRGRCGYAVDPNMKIYCINAGHADNAGEAEEIVSWETMKFSKNPKFCYVTSNHASDYLNSCFEGCIEKVTPPEPIDTKAGIPFLLRRRAIIKMSP